MSSKRVDLKRILADSDLRRKLMVSTIQATQAREGIQTTVAQASRAYYVVTEGEKTSFFDLDKFKPGKAQGDLRHEMFVRTLRNGPNQVRFDIARRDFAAIDGAPLNYRGIGSVAHIFREAPALEPGWGIAAQGLATADDPQFVRCRWEIPEGVVGEGRSWAPFAKGGEFSRFYADIYLVVQWTAQAQKAMGAIGRVQNVGYYFKPGLTWPLRTQRGFNVRVLPRGCVFGHKGPAIIPTKEIDTFYVLGVANSTPAEYLLRGLMSFGSWEVGVIKRLPVPLPSLEQREQIATIARSIYQAKASWDRGNEISTAFVVPWLVSREIHESLSITDALNRLGDFEEAEDNRIQQQYVELNNHAYAVYGIPAGTRKEIEEDTRHARDRHRLVPGLAGERHERFNWHCALVAPTVGRVDAHLPHLLRPGLLGDVIQDQIPELEVIVDGIEFELAILKPDSPRALLPRGVEGVEIGLSECH